MKKSDVTRLECGAGFSRLELTSERGIQGNYHCPACGTPIEELGAAHLVIYRLTVQPSTKAIRNQ
ncbi:hypothetical protein GGD63_004701 [Bradyrhizobium sp. cir1]|uniref:hypothetical protein n=1 Tax=Bradyrhizobium sp. cir1 TaxID=1445730 RepID=UPI001605C5F0|nr:hypothetical protein [Bradyrhizobium sp. cir1]MBB4371900.1 hypothetical protein [Bradyrhizobium sp. cir1]